ncbi:hypothetical protein Neosp_002971 [[Neocosmospora] mangrovei]
MVTTKALLAAFCFSAAAASQARHVSPGVKTACSELCQEYGESVVFPSSVNYTKESTDYWDIRSNLLPACIFLPTDAAQVSHALRLFSKHKAQFAIRGGGHMNFPGSNNIDGGVVLALSKLNHIKVHRHNLTYDVGPGNRWVDVYTALEPYGLYSIGGRLKTIGVPGLSLIGGFHYFSNKYGFAMDNIVKYEVVLANGTQVVASKTSHPDLFWGLKGSANNLGVVTKFTFKALSIPKISTTIQAFDESALEDFITATVDLVKYQGSELAAGQVITLQYNATTKVASAQLIGAQEGTESPPSTFANFTAIQSVSKLHNVTAPLAFHSQLETPNQMFRVQDVHGTMLPDVKQLLYLFKSWKSAVDDVSDVEGLYPTFVINTIPKSAASVAKNNGVGNIWGLDDKKSTLIWQFSTGWAHARDDLRMTNWGRTTFEYLESVNRAKGLAVDFIYMGDTSELQDPFSSFPLKNVQRLKKIRDIYDTERAFVSLNWGGFKLGA